jgi:hypothetical protein
MTAEPFAPLPTATAFPSLRAVAPSIAATPLGVGTTLQLIPSKCSARVCVAPPPVAVSPTAPMSLPAIAAAALRIEPLIRGLGTTGRASASLD